MIHLLVTTTPAPFGAVPTLYLYRRAIRCRSLYCDNRILWDASNRDNGVSNPRLSGAVRRRRFQRDKISGSALGI